MTGKGVLVYGEALIDFVPGSAGRSEAVLGGNEAAPAASEAAKA